MLTRNRTIGKIATNKQLDPSKDPYRSAFIARKRIERLRVAESRLEISQALRKKYDNENYKPGEPSFEGLVRDDNSERLPINNKVVIDCDLKSAVQAINTKNNINLRLSDYYQAWRNGKLGIEDNGGSSSSNTKGGNHVGNIQQIQYARGKMAAGRCSLDP